MGIDTLQTVENPHIVQDQTWLATMELASLCCLPMALKAAINLDIFQILSTAGTQLTVEEIVSQIPASNPNATASLDRVLRLLACHSILGCSSVSHDRSDEIVRKYGLTPMSKYLVKDNKGFSLAPMVLMHQDKVLMDTWHYLDNEILQGEEPFTKAHGKDAFSYGQEDVRYNKLFNAAMSNHTTLTMQALLETYDGFKDIHTLVDVGGGIGSCLEKIVSKHPHIRGINFDQPHVVEAAPNYPGVEHAGGNMFVSVPRGDAIFMKWILHDWSDEHCLKLLQNCYEALEENGRVIALETVLPCTPETDIAARVRFHHDLLMLAYNSGGKERTEEELRKLAMAAGFGGMKVVCEVKELNVIELYKSSPNLIIISS